MEIHVDVRDVEHILPKPRLQHVLGAHDVGQQGPEHVLVVAADDAARTRWCPLKIHIWPSRRWRYGIDSSCPHHLMLFTSD